MQGRKTASAATCIRLSILCTYIIRVVRWPVSKIVKTGVKQQIAYPLVPNLYHQNEILSTCIRSVSLTDLTSFNTKGGNHKAIWLDVITKVQQDMANL